jgi:predicted transcriptional regulator
VKAGPTYVDEIVWGDWEPGGNPYIVIGDAVVPAGHQLNISEGVHVHFLHNTGLIVQGSLVVEGAEGNPVVFTSNDTDKFKGSWKGIIIGLSTENVFEHAKIEYATRGIHCMEQSFVTISHSEISNNSVAGVHLVASHAEISYSSLIDNNVGVVGEDSEIYVGSSEFIWNTDYGITLSQSTLEMESSNIISEGMGGAMFLRDVSSAVTLDSFFSKERVDFFGLPSTLLVQWSLKVRVQDIYSSGVQWATVTINSDLLEEMVFETGSEGWIETVIIKDVLMSTVEEVIYNPYYIRASRSDFDVDEELNITEPTTLTLTILADFISPQAMAGEDRMVDEDEDVLFDARFSEDNDPNFFTTGTFLWTFYDHDGSSNVNGVEVTYVFHTPGIYTVRLKAEDAFGNWDDDFLEVTVDDITDPNAVASVPSKTQVGEMITLDATASVDNDPDFSGSGNHTWTFKDGNDDVTLYGETADYRFRHAGTYSVELNVKDGSGNSATDTVQIQVLETPMEFPLLPVLAIALVGAALAGVANTEVGKYWFLKFLILPLYVKLSKKDVLNHFIRGQIYGYIKVNPGDNYTTIKRNLDLRNGTLTYHLDVLEREGLVKSQVRGSRRHYYTSDARMPDDGTGFPAIKSDIISRLGETPGITISDLASLLGVSRQLANYHVRGLIKEGYVRVERMGMSLRCFLTEKGPGF